MNRFILFVISTCVIVAACHTSAEAATEFCPAKLTRLDKTGGDGKAYGYYLQALTSRTVQGTIIADTDAGWFTWVQQPVRLTRTTYTRIAPSTQFSYHIAESPEMTVVFPRPVTIRQAWVATARSKAIRC
jgi:hypothetical protein